jgi:SPW repeat
MPMMRSPQVTSSLTVLVGMWVFLSPWLLGYSEFGRPSWNAAATGLAITAVAAAVLAGRSRAVAWGNLLLGAWLTLSPRVLDYTSVETAARNAWFAGLIVVALAAITATSGRADQRYPTRPGRRPPAR